MKDSVIDLRKEEKKRARKKIPVACAQRNRFIPGFMIACALLSILSLLYLDIDWLKLLSRTPEIGGVFWELLQFDFSSMDVIGSSLLETVFHCGAFPALQPGARCDLRNAGCEKYPAAALAVRAHPVLFHLSARGAHRPYGCFSCWSCLGMGPEAGVAGLCVHTTAFFTKSFAQSFESIPEETIEALEATGTGRLSIFTNAVLPAAFSQIVAWTGMRLETNFQNARSSAWWARAESAT